MAKQEIDISIGIDALIENGFFYLEEHQWKRAKEYFEKAIEISPRNPYPYIGKLLVTHKLPTMDSLPECPIDFRNTNNYKTALRYADESLKLKFDSYAAQYEKKLDEKYQTICSEFSIANSLEDYSKCYQAFVDLGNYKDSVEFAQKAKEFIAQYNYEIYVKKIDNNLSEDECLRIYYDLLSMDYKESKKYATLYREKYEKINLEKENESIYFSAISRMNDAKSGADYIEIKKIFESISGYKDSNQWIQKCEDKIKRNRIPLFFHNLWNNDTALIVITIILFSISLPMIHEDMLMSFVISEIISIGLGIVIGKAFDCIGKGILFGFLSGLVLGLALGWISNAGSNDCQYCGGRGYFGGGGLGQMVDCPSCSN